MMEHFMKFFEDIDDPHDKNETSNQLTTNLRWKEESERQKMIKKYLSGFTSLSSISYISDMVHNEMQTKDLIYLVEFNEIQIYNIAQNQWTTTTTPYDDSAQYEWYYSYCHIVNDELFVFGGQLAHPGTIERTLLRDIHKYNLKLDQWTKLPVSLPVNSGSNGVIVFYNDVLYLVGDTKRNIINAFNINTQTFDETITLPTSVYCAGVVLVDNVIYVFGGTAADRPISDIQICTLPTADPTGAPSAHSTHPSVFPSKFPSTNPSHNPSRLPSKYPSRFPSINPTVFPSISPSANPSTFPSIPPSAYPSRFPSVSPSGNPSTFPSILPSVNPSKPTANNNGEAEVVEVTGSSIAPTQLENKSDEQTMIGDLDNIYVTVLVVIPSIVVIVCVVVCLYWKKGKNKMIRDVDHVVAANAIASGVVPDETAAVQHDFGNQTNVQDVVLQQGENMNDSEDEDILCGVNTLGGDVVRDNEDCDKDILSGVNTLGGDVLCNDDFEDEEDVIVGANTLGEGDTFAPPTAVATNSTHGTMDFIGSVEEDEIIVGDDETDMGGTVQ
eukprot:916133_1